MGIIVGDLLADLDRGERLSRKRGLRENEKKKNRECEREGE